MIHFPVWFILQVRNLDKDEITEDATVDCDDNSDHTDVICMISSSCQRHLTVGNSYKSCTKTCDNDEATHCLQKLWHLHLIRILCEQWWLTSGFDPDSWCLTDNKDQESTDFSGIWHIYNFRLHPRPRLYVHQWNGLKHLRVLHPTEQMRNSWRLGSSQEGGQEQESYCEYFIYFCHLAMIILFMCVLTGITNYYVMCGNNNWSPSGC